MHLLGIKLNGIDLFITGSLLFESHLDLSCNTFENNFGIKQKFTKYIYMESSRENSDE